MGTVEIHGASFAGSGDRDQRDADIRASFPEGLPDRSLSGRRLHLLRQLSSIAAVEPFRFHLKAISRCPPQPMKTARVPASFRVLTTSSRSAFHGVPPSGKAKSGPKVLAPGGGAR